MILLARIILSWFPPPASGPVRTIVDVIYAVTDPVLRPFRNLIPPVRAGGIALDFSPIIIFVIIAVIRQALC